MEKRYPLFFHVDLRSKPVLYGIDYKIVMGGLWLLSLTGQMIKKTNMSEILTLQIDYDYF
jgi:hypothetical protein